MPNGFPINPRVGVPRPGAPSLGGLRPSAIQPASPVGGQGKGAPAGSVGTVPLAPPEQPVSPAAAPPGKDPNIQAGFGPHTFGSLDIFKTYQRGRMSRLLGGRMPINY